MKKAILYSALCLSGSALLATEGDGQAFTEEGPGFKEITIRIGGSRALTAALLDGAAKEKKVTGIADFDSFSAIYGLMGIYPKGTVPSSSLYGHRFRLRGPPDSDVAEITGPYRNLTYIGGRWGGVESKREVGNKPHVDKGRAVGEFSETADTLSQKTGLLDNLGIEKRIALKLGTGTLAGVTSSYTLKKILHGLGFKFFCDLYPYFFCGELISLMTGTVVGVTLVDPHDNPFWSSVGSGMGIAIGLPLAEKTDTIWPLYVGSSGGSILLSELSRRRLNASRFSVGLAPDSSRYLSWIAVLRF